MPQGERRTPRRRRNVVLKTNIWSVINCLACVCVFQATESVDHVADLWRSADEDLRSAARETVLSFGTNTSFVHSLVFYYVLFYPAILSYRPWTGKKGYLAFQRMDQLYTEMQEEAYQNQETEITIL